MDTHQLTVTALLITLCFVWGLAGFISACVGEYIKSSDFVERARKDKKYEEETHRAVLAFFVFMASICIGLLLVTHSVVS